MVKSTPTIRLACLAASLYSTHWYHIAIMVTSQCAAFWQMKYWQIALKTANPPKYISCQNFRPNGIWLCYTCYTQNVYNHSFCKCQCYTADCALSEQRILPIQHQHTCVHVMTYYECMYVRTYYITLLFQHPSGTYFYKSNHMQR